MIANIRRTVNGKRNYQSGYALNEQEKRLKWVKIFKLPTDKAIPLEFDCSRVFNWIGEKLNFENRLKYSTTKRQFYVCVQSEVCNIPEKKVLAQ